ncbi:hypothetical protein AB5N19_05764 [Seiridium cardinale]|uniref:C2H2-type domain-containing protein n=1 Tax=Seiridium cardinale TaxID=138064 RepID=A0ABR2XGX5_9PEZI
MSGENHECTCDAFFLTREKLNEHIREQSSQADYHLVQLEKSRAHARVSSDDDNEDSDHNLDAATPKITIGKPCPHVGCPRRPTPFTTQQKLRRHFRIRKVQPFHSIPYNELISNVCSTDVPCKAVCTFCTRTPKVFDLASEFMRHWETNHKREDQTSAEATYMQTKYTDLERLVKEKLAIEQVEQINREGRKRICAEATEAPSSQRVKVANTSTVDDTAPAFDLASTLPLSTQPTTSFMSDLTGEHGATLSSLNNFASIPNPRAAQDLNC